MSNKYKNPNANDFFKPGTVKSTGSKLDIKTLNFADPKDRPIIEDLLMANPKAAAGINLQKQNDAREMEEFTQKLKDRMDRLLAGKFANYVLEESEVINRENEKLKSENEEQLAKGEAIFQQAILDFRKTQLIEKYGPEVAATLLGALHFPKKEDIPQNPNLHSGQSAQNPQIFPGIYGGQFPQANLPNPQPYPFYPGQYGVYGPQYNPPYGHYPHSFSPYAPQNSPPMSSLPPNMTGQPDSPKEERASLEKSNISKLP